MFQSASASFVASVSHELFALVVTALLMFASALASHERNRRSRLFSLMLIVNAAALAADLVTWIWEGPEYTTLLYVANSLVFALGYVMTSLFTAYLQTYFHEEHPADRVLVGGTYCLSVVSCATVAVSAANGMYFYVEDGRIQAGDFGWLAIALSLAMMLASMVLMFVHRAELGAKNTLAFLMYCVFPLVAFGVQMTGTELTVTWLASTLTMLLIYLMVHVEYVVDYEHQRSELLESRLMLSQSQTALVLSQIQPHFLYNSLTVIDQLVKTDPALARKAIADFSTYLRCNLGSLKNTGLIPLSEELRHVRAFLALEELRFGDLLRVEYHVGTDDFLVPSLSIQPLVENAVEHGLCNKEDGGTVRVFVSERPNCYLIEVADDGVGFVPGEVKGSGEHVGIANIRARLESLCGGELSISSVPGQGTLASIKIFKAAEPEELGEERDS